MSRSQIPDGHMILEGIVTTVDEDDTINVAPMGPIVDRAITRLQLRPFQTSRTYQNLKHHGEGVLHVTDDVELFARCAIGQLESIPAHRMATSIRGAILTDACRWYEFRVTGVDDSEMRTVMDCEITDVGRQRDFFGFNRAKHAVIEAAILATRLHLLESSDVRRKFDELETMIVKTAGDQERRAFQLLYDHLLQHHPT